METVRVVFISIPRDEANNMAHALMEKRLAACINIVPKIESFYWWDDAVQRDEEALLIVKTTRQRIDELMRYVQVNHPYDLPEVISLPLSEGLPDYIAWVKKETEEG